MEKLDLKLGTSPTARSISVNGLEDHLQVILERKNSAKLEIEIRIRFDLLLQLIKEHIVMTGMTG